ncbi:MAG: DUF3426 domain-containing protein [Pseudomonadota bacterium]
MIVTCPQCATQYNLPESSVREGAKARCAQCKTIFIIHVQAQALPVDYQAQQQIIPQQQVILQQQVTPQQQGISQQQVQSQPQQAAFPTQNQGQNQVQNSPYKQAPAEIIVADGLPPLTALTRTPQHNPAASSVASPVASSPVSPPTSPSSLLDAPAMQGASPVSPQVSYQAAYEAPPAQQAPQAYAASPYTQAQSLHMDHLGDVSSMTGQANLARRPHNGQVRETATPLAYGSGESANNPHAFNESHQDEKPTALQSFVTALLFLAIFGMLGYGAWRYMPRLGNDQLEAEASRIAHVSDQIKDIALHNVRQYTVQSSKAGLLLVIEGRIINNFRSPREMVKVEAALYDKDGKRLESTQQLCGVLVSKLQMQIWDAKEIEAALDNELEAYAHNVNIASGTSVPFMVVFVDPPASVASYGVHVVDAQIPPNYK